MRKCGIGYARKVSGVLRIGLEAALGTIGCACTEKDTEDKMAARIWDKKFTQKVLRTLRKAGYRVEKTGPPYLTYKAYAPDDEEVFVALSFSWGYAITHHVDLFHYKQDTSSPIAEGFAKI